MLWMRRVATVVLIGVASYLSIDSTAVFGTESGPVKSEPAPAPTSPAQTPTQPKAHNQEGEMKPPAKAPAHSPPTESVGKETAPGKSEPPPSPAPTLPKPPAKAQTPPNGPAAPKSASPQLPAEITGKDGAPMVLVPAGEFTMGSDKGDYDEVPIHRVFLDSFYIDKFEVTNGRFAKYVKAILIEPPWSFADKDTPVVRADYPVRWVNWMEAMGYCLWAGKRLPTEAEWEKAARGTDARVYPWGNDPPTKAHAVFEGSESVLPVGNREKGKSPYGVHDMAGSLYEWTMDWYDESYYTDIPAMNPRGPLEGTAKAQRGGSYTNAPFRLRSTFRTKGIPTEHEPNVGFRCVQEVPKQP